MCPEDMMISDVQISSNNVLLKIEEEKLKELGRFLGTSNNHKIEDATIY